MHTGSHKLNNALGQCLLAKRMGKPRHHRRDRRGPARRRHRDRLRAARARVRRLHGHRGHAPPAAQRAADAAARRDASSRRRRGLAHAQGGRLGRDPRLGRQRRRHALRDRLVRRPGAVPRARARPAARDRRRGARRSCSSAAGRLPRARRSPASAAARTRSARSSRSSTTRASSSIGVEAAGEGIATGRHGAPLTVGGRGGVLHGSYSAIMQDEDGQITEAHSISAGLDYPGVGPGARVAARLRPRALRGGHRRPRRSPRSAGCAELEGIIPALESSHAIAWVLANPRRRDGRARPRLPVRPRRQGPRRGAGALGVSVAAPAHGRDRRRVRGRRAKRAALMPYLMGGFPDLGRLARDRRGLRRARRRPASSSACRSPTRSPTAR